MFLKPEHVQKGAKLVSLVVPVYCDPRRGKMPLTEEERRNLQEAWKMALSPALVRDLFVRAYGAGCDSANPVTLVAVAASTLMPPIPAPSDRAHPTERILRNDVLILRLPAMDFPEGPTIYMYIIGGTAIGLISLPMRVFLFGEEGYALQGELDVNGNWAPLPYLQP
jgi:hypothetical protein